MEFDYYLKIFDEMIDYNPRLGSAVLFYFVNPFCDGFEKRTEKENNRQMRGFIRDFARQETIVDKKGVLSLLEKVK